MTCLPINSSMLYLFILYLVCSPYLVILSLRCTNKCEASCWGCWHYLILLTRPKIQHQPSLALLHKCVTTLVFTVLFLRSILESKPASVFPRSCSKPTVLGAIFVHLLSSFIVHSSKSTHHHTQIGLVVTPCPACDLVGRSRFLPLPGGFRISQYAD